jgi:hypothetical protein
MKMRQIEIHFMQLIVITLTAHVATGACRYIDTAEK